MNSSENYKIKEHSFFAKIAAKKLGTKNVALVLGKTIYLYNTSKEEFLQNKKWVKHELCHVQQYQRYGFLGFIYRYLFESIKNGYHNNKFEVEARKAEDL